MRDRGKFSFHPTGDKKPNSNGSKCNEIEPNWKNDTGNADKFASRPSGCLRIHIPWQSNPLTSSIRAGSIRHDHVPLLGLCYAKPDFAIISSITLKSRFVLDFFQSPTLVTCTNSYTFLTLSLSSVLQRGLSSVQKLVFWFHISGCFSNRVLLMERIVCYYGVSSSYRQQM
ncbi:hypothetical protein FRC14_000261 [Serendipita sp. 396]|nr:hypothetical protein FRC14_000261 [Serendipita sp. 396]